MTEIKRDNHCMFREEDGICAIRRQTDSTPEKPLCTNPNDSTNTCRTAINWNSPNLSPVDLGIYPPMGEIE